MGTTFEATRIVARSSQRCRHIVEVVIEGQPWTLAQVAVTLQLGNRVNLRHGPTAARLALRVAQCDCGALTLVHD
jgi:hypothetical protein